MTTMELEARKAGLIREILTKVDNLELLEKLSKYLHKHLQPASTPPCHYTVEKMDKILAQGREDINKGNTVTHEKMANDVFGKFMI